MKQAWCGVPINILPEWDKIFTENKEILNLSVPCPICDTTNLHRFYQLGKKINKTIAGQKFISFGGLWHWCSHCRHYEHLTALVPEWWVCNLKVNEKELTAEPEAIEKVLSRPSS